MTAIKFDPVKLLTFLVIISITFTSIYGCYSTESNKRRCVPFTLCVVDTKRIIFPDFFCGNNQRKYERVCCSEDLIIKEQPDSIEEEEATKGIIEFTTAEATTSTSTTSAPEVKQPFDLDSCGIIGGKGRVAMGEEAPVLEYPWAALIEYFDNEKPYYACGGSLINDRYVLTAAHCLQHKGQLKKVNSVVLGEHRVSTEKDCIDDSFCADPIQKITNFQPEDLIVHPEYDFNLVINDIGLIRLTEPAKVHQNNIQPICLPFKKKYEKIPKKMIVIGFGKTENDARMSDVLRRVTVPFVKNDQCIEEYRGTKAEFLTDRQFCAGDMADSCKGDSGSPIQFPALNGKKIQTFQYGVVSFGQSQCGGSKPGIYTKVYSFMDWIIGQIKP